MVVRRDWSRDKRNRQKQAVERYDYQLDQQLRRMGSAERAELIAARIAEAKARNQERKAQATAVHLTAMRVLGVMPQQVEWKTRAGDKQLMTVWPCGCSADIDTELVACRECGVMTPHWLCDKCSKAQRASA